MVILRLDTVRTRGCARPWSLRRVFADQTVDRLAEQVGMADVPGVLVMQVDEYPPRVRCPVRVEGEPHGAIETTIGDDLIDRGSAPRGRVAPELVELVG